MYLSSLNLYDYRYQLEKFINYNKNPNWGKIAQKLSKLKIRKKETFFLMNTYPELKKYFLLI